MRKRKAPASDRDKSSIARARWEGALARPAGVDAQAQGTGIGQRRIKHNRGELGRSVGHTPCLGCCGRLAQHGQQAGAGHPSAIDPIRLAPHNESA
jgi:hypothetical protein